MNFDKYVDLGNHYHNLDIEGHHHPKELPDPLLQGNTPPSAPGPGNHLATLSL